MNQKMYLSPEQMEKQKRKQKRVAIVIFPLAIIIAIIISVNGAIESEKEPVISKEKIELEAKVIARVYIQQQLKAPSTAKFGHERNSMKDSVTYVIRNTVDAQNSFGAMIRKDYQVILKYLGGNPENISNWELIDSRMQ